MKQFQNLVFYVTGTDVKFKISVDSNMFTLHTQVNLLQGMNKHVFLRKYISVLCIIRYYCNSLRTMPTILTVQTMVIFMYIIQVIFPLLKLFYCSTNFKNIHQFSVCLLPKPR